MEYIVDHDLHIHSVLSTCCAHPLQTPERLLEYAKENSLNTICITDHFWDETVEGANDWYEPQNFAHISKSLPLPQAEGIRFLFGAEAEMNKDFKIGISKERIDKLDFLIIPTTHMRGEFTLTKEQASSREGRAKAWVDRLDNLLKNDLPFHKIGIAHLACTHIAQSATREEKTQILELIPQSELKSLFDKAAALGVGIEINANDFSFESEREKNAVLRIFSTAKESGCKFYLASDCHHPNRLGEAIPIFKRAINLLGLTESDKFIF